MANLLYGGQTQRAGTFGLPFMQMGLQAAQQKQQFDFEKQKLDLTKFFELQNFQLNREKLKLEQDKLKAQLDEIKRLRKEEKEAEEERAEAVLGGRRPVVEGKPVKRFKTPIERAMAGEYVRTGKGLADLFKIMQPEKDHTATWMAILGPGNEAKAKEMSQIEPPTALLTEIYGKREEKIRKKTEEEKKEKERKIKERESKIISQKKAKGEWKDADLHAIREEAEREVEEEEFRQKRGYLPIRGKAAVDPGIGAFFKGLFTTNPLEFYTSLLKPKTEEQEFYEFLVKDKKMNPVEARKYVSEKFQKNRIHSFPRIR